LSAYANQRFFASSFKLSVYRKAYGPIAYSSEQFDYNLVGISLTEVEMKSFTLLILLAFSSFCVVGCSVNREIPKKMSHIYNVNIVSTGDPEPIEGATIKLFKDDQSHPLMETADSEGFARFEVSGSPVRDGRNVYFKSNVKIVANKEGYRQVGEAEFENKTNWRYGQNDSWTLSAITIAMVDIDSYLCDEIKKNGMYNDAKKIASWLKDFAILDDLLLNNICTETYKGNEYFSIKMNSTIKFNENKLTDYDVAKRLFISPILEYIKSPNYISNKSSVFYGSEFTINTKIEDFSKTYGDIGRTIVLKYYIPASSIKSFVNQNISRQELLDASVLLVNDDLIKVKFQ